MSRIHDEHVHQRREADQRSEGDCPTEWQEHQTRELDPAAKLLVDRRMTKPCRECSARGLLSKSWNEMLRLVSPASLRTDHLLHPVRRHDCREAVSGSKSSGFVDQVLVLPP